MSSSGISRARREYEVAGLPAGQPYAHAVGFGDLLFVSGLVGVDAQGAVVGADAAAQTRQIMQNMEKVLAAAGAKLADILKLTVFLTDMADRAAVGAVRREFLGTTRAASTLVEVSRLVDPAWKVEIEAVVGLPAA